MMFTRTTVELPDGGDSDPVSNLFHSFSNMSQPVRMEEQSDVTLFIPLRSITVLFNEDSKSNTNCKSNIFLLTWLYFF